MVHTQELKLIRRTLTSASGARTPFLLTDIGEGIAEVEVIKFFVKEGDKVSQFQPLVEVQSDKATVEISSRYDGIIDALSYNPGDIATVGTPLCYIRTSQPEEAHVIGEENETGRAPEPVVEAQASHQDSPEQLRSQLESQNGVLATPLVRGIAREKEIDIETIFGTGPDGRVTEEDLVRNIEGRSNQTDGRSGEIGSEEDQGGYTPEEKEVTTTVEPIRGLRRGMLKSMTAAAEIAQLGLSDDVNMERAISFRKQTISHLGKESQLRFTFMPIFMKATSLALTKFPVLNASIDLKSHTIVYHSSHNISVAMNTKEGLIVPNVKDVEKKSMIEIAEDLRTLAEVAKSGKFGKQELEGGTFTLSNIGSIGAKSASPVVFPPQVCIGAIGSIAKRAVVEESGGISAAEVLSVSWAADHRIVDGATLALFNKTWKEYMEHPETMLLNLK